MTKLALFAVVAGLFLAISPLAAGAQAPVNLGTAAAFAVLGGSAVTNTGPTTLMGDLGVSPGSSITGFPPGLVTGATHTSDAVAAQAQSDLTIAYNDAAGRTPATVVATELGGQTMLPGVYTSAAGTFEITGALTLDAQGDSSAVFIFQTASTLTTASASSMILIGGAKACNVFWKIGSSATLGTHSYFVGNVLASASITATTGAVIDGRLLARTGAVTLDSNTITRGGCSAPAATTPGAPNLTATPGDGEIHLTWTTPNPGSEPITGYNIYRDGVLLTPIGPENAYTDEGLENGVPHTYQVSAVNSVGEGPKSNEATATPSATDTETEIPFFPNGASLAIGVMGVLATAGFVVWRKKRRT